MSISESSQLNHAGAIRMCIRGHCVSNTMYYMAMQIHKYIVHTSGTCLVSTWFSTYSGIISIPHSVPVHT